MSNSGKTKITNSVLFRAMKWLMDNGHTTCDMLDAMTSREIMDMYELRSATFTVEYSNSMGNFQWKGSTYQEAVRRTALVTGLGYSPEVWRESDRECVTREFIVPTWV